MGLFEGARFLAVAALLSGSAQDPSGPLVVLNAGSLAVAMNDLTDGFHRRFPRVSPRSEASGSVDAARKITDLGKQADVLATADAAVLDKLVLPRHATWYATFASNSMVIAYTPRSPGASAIDARTWIDVLRRPGVRIGRAEPALDPAGYRALMMFQLAERHYRVAGLARALLERSGERYMRPKSVELMALLETGHLDYAVVYRTIALSGGYRFVELPPEIDLSDPEHADFYATARVDIPRSRRDRGDPVTFAGEPIAYAITIPAEAPNPAAARAFVRWVLGPEGRAVLSRHGFVLPSRPRLVGDTAAAASVLRPGR